MDDHRTAPYAALLLRVGLGVMFLAHGLWLKAFVFGLPGNRGVLRLGRTAGAARLPGIRGRDGRRHAADRRPAHAPGGAGAPADPARRDLGALAERLAVTNPDGGFEYPLFLALAAGVQALLGDGAHAVSRRALAVRLVRA